LLIGHAQRNAEGVFDEHHDKRGPDEVPADDEKRTDDLEPDLLAIPSDGTSKRCDRECSSTTLGGKDTSEESADEGSNKMSMEDIEGIIDMLEKANVTLAQVKSNLIDLRKLTQK